MKNLTKHLIRAGVIAASFATLTPMTMTASAGEWRINANACPDLREDRVDRRYDRGWNDRREDRRDSRVIRCPARAWYYVRYRGESRYYTPPRPREIIVYRNYDRYRGRDYDQRYAYNDGYYYRNDRGAMVRLDLDLRLRG